MRDKNNYKLCTVDMDHLECALNNSNYLGSPCDICRCLDTRDPNFCSSLLHLACHWGKLVLLVPLDFFPHISKILNTDLNYLFLNSSQINVLVRPLSHLMIMSFVMEIPEDVLVCQKESLSLQTCPSLRGTWNLHHKRGTRWPKELLCLTLQLALGILDRK